MSWKMIGHLQVDKMLAVRTARQRQGHTCTRKATGAAESRSDEEASAMGGRLPAKHRLIAAAKADIEPHTTAPVAV